MYQCMFVHEQEYVCVHVCVGVGMSPGRGIVDAHISTQSTPHPQSTEVQRVIPGLASAEPVWSFLLQSLPLLINAVYTGCAGGNWPL